MLSAQIKNKNLKIVKLLTIIFTKLFFIMKISNAWYILYISSDIYYSIIMNKMIDWRRKKKEWNKSEHVNFAK